MVSPHVYWSPSVACLLSTVCSPLVRRLPSLSAAVARRRNSLLRHFSVSFPCLLSGVLSLLSFRSLATSLFLLPLATYYLLLTTYYVTTYYSDTLRLTIYRRTIKRPQQLLLIINAPRPITHNRLLTHALAIAHAPLTTFRPHKAAPTNSNLLPPDGINLAHTGNVTVSSHSACTMRMLLYAVNHMSVFQNASFEELSYLLCVEKRSTCDTRDGCLRLHKIIDHRAIRLQSNFL